MLLHNTLDKRQTHDEINYDLNNIIPSNNIKINMIVYNKHH